MKRLSALKYFTVLTLPVLAYISFTSYGWITFAPILEAFVCIPLLEVFFKPDEKNLNKVEEELQLQNPFYDWMLYIMVPIQFLLLYQFLVTINEPGLVLFERIGRISSMGLLCGVVGINVAHELGHRTRVHEKIMAKMLLLTSLYMHFYIEHNKGHHRNVATPEDPSSARLGENLYSFLIRSVFNSYVSAWRLELEKLKKKKTGIVSFYNEMLWFHVIQGILILFIFTFFGFQVTIYFMISAVMGFLLLETVNYIEHYGLARNKIKNGYERVMPNHSWNSDHTLGRLVLFELSRHSDHHYNANRKYQILRHMDTSPQMPTGYPGMMLISIVPPLWFFVMNRKLKTIDS